MVNPADARRRWFGSLFLILAVGMLIWGQTVLKPRLEGLVFVAYWLVCFAFTGLAVLVAMLDLLIVRQRGRKEQRELLDQAWKKVSPDEERPE